MLGTTDLHGHLFNWDYYRDTEHRDSGGDHVGLAKVATLVNQVCAEAGREHTLLIDAGDTIQGTPLATYYATVEPIGDDRVHPMAAAMNAMGYDAATLGNHEFNYGVELLETFAAQLDFPLLGANAVDWDTGEPAFMPYFTTTMGPLEAPVRIGVLGLTNPGIAIWDRAHVEGRMRFPGLVEQAQHWVPRMRASGCDVVIVAAHSGSATSSSYGDALPHLENASTLIAQQVPGIDAMLIGHAHMEIEEHFVTNEATGRPVLLTEPLYFGKRLSVIELDLERSPSGSWHVASSGSHVLDSRTVPEDADIVRLLRAAHQQVVEYTHQVIGTCTATMSSAAARYEDTAIIDFVNHVQGRHVERALADTSLAGTQVLSATSPFARDAVIPEGDVAIRHLSGLYPFDNTLVGVRLRGRQLRDYLETSAAYFQQVLHPGPHQAHAITNAPTESSPKGAPDYSFDIVAGFRTALTYDIDVTCPASNRITKLTYGGEPVGDDQEFVLALNHYRQAGTGMFPHVRDAEIVYDGDVEIRQLLIDYVTEVGIVDPAVFAQTDWRLVADGHPLIVEP